MEDTPEYKITPNQPKMKMCGDNKVPFGCYYDPSEQYDAFKLRLKDSIFKSFEVIEQEICRKFLINPDYISYEACFHQRWTKNLSPIKLREFLDEKCIDDDFFMQLIINCRKFRNGNDVHFWGTVLDMYYYVEYGYDELEDINLPIWYISIGNISSNIDEPFSPEKIDSIKTSVLNSLVVDYEHFYSKLT